MHNAGKGVHRFAVHQDLEFHQVVGTVRPVLVIHRSVPPCDRFDPVAEVHEDFIERDLRGQHHALGVKRLRLLHLPPFFPHHRHQVPNILVGAQQVDRHHRLADLLDHARIRHLHRIFHFEHLPIGQVHLVNDAWVCRDHLHIELARKPLLHDFHVQQPEESAPKTKSQRGRTFRGVDEGRIVDLQFPQRQFQLLEIGRINRIDAGKNHRLNLPESGQGLLCRLERVRDGVPDVDFRRCFQVGHQVARVPRSKALARSQFRAERTHLLGLILSPALHQLDGCSRGDLPGNHPHIGDHPPERVKDAVEHQRL